MKHFLIVVLGVILSATMSMAQDTYRVQPGDTLQIEVLEDPSLDRAVLITPDGRFTFPRVGSVRAAGRTVSQIQRNLVTAIQNDFNVEINVFVSVASLNPEEPEPEVINVYVLGEVNTPGLREVAPGSTFLQALSQAGGFTNFAATKRVQLRRTHRGSGQQSLTTIDYNALALGAGLSRSIVLRDGDVILVPERRLFE